MPLRAAFKPIALLGAIALLVIRCIADPAICVTVQADAPGTHINPAMWGVFFEDINFGADGGLSAELIKNGSFEFPDPRMGWTRLGDKNTSENSVRYLARSDGAPANMRLAEITSEPNDFYGLSNEGFRGIGLKASEDYDFTIEARCVASSGPLKLKVELVGGHAVLASASLNISSSNWAQLKVTLKPSATVAKAKLTLILEDNGTVQIDRVSLFPTKTWKNRPQGLRADMVQRLADMKPGFIRFPGGCVVEGFNLGLRYQWKQTILPREERMLLLNRWNVEFKDRPVPDYYQSFGLGFWEYFQLCEDLNAEPLPILNCGMACQYNSGELAPMEALQPYIQDALDLIEFANGPVTSTWGAKRAALGHPEPFRMKLLGIGNEQWGPQYVERYQAFAKELKAKHPEVQLLVAAGPSPSGARFDYLWEQWKRLKPDLVDEHSYSSPSWFIEGFTRYDGYDRTGTKVFVGEYACHTKEQKNNLTAAISEAVFMLGLERNADVVRMAAYAPLFAHVDAWQWRPDLIWFDNLRTILTPSYYVQQLFSLNRGDVVLPVVLALAGSTTGKTGQLYASAVLEEKTGDLIVKIVNPANEKVEASLKLAGLPIKKRRVRVTVLTAASGEMENTPEAPDRVAPQESALESMPSAMVFQAQSFTVLRVEQF